MSSGFFGFFAHAGVLHVLEEEGLLPARACGSSAGALVTGLWAAGVPTSRLLDELQRVDRRDFWDPALGPGLLQGKLFGTLLERLLPVRTFEDCRIPLSISVFDVRSLRTQAVASGELGSAIQASCAVPLLFHPLRRQGRALYDGGILDRAGLAGVQPRERIFYHHLQSRLPFGSLHPLLGRGVPERAGLVSFVVRDLPRCDPFRLDQGPRAIELAASALRSVLDRPMRDSALRFP
jgi:NTE family protein